MLSLVIKNAILIILIILIVHFLLKGMLDERRTPIMPVIQAAQPQPSPSAPKTELSAEPMPLSAAHLLEGMSNASVGSHKDGKDDLFSYVYGGKDVSASASAYADASTSLEEKEKVVPVKKSSVGEEKEAPKDAGTAHHMIIREYTDEKPLNGGNLFNGLSAFDAEFAPYASL